jgi:hypothetical protein
MVARDAGIGLAPPLAPEAEAAEDSLPQERAVDV